MAVDFDAIRKKLNKLSGGSSRRDSMWRPQEDEEAVVRIIAFPDNDGQPFKERWFYYNIGNNPGLLAPYQFGNPDPIQELISKLRDDGDNKASYELAKKLYPKMRAYAAVIVRGEESKGVRLWSFGKQVYQSLLNIMLDEDYGDITDPKTGRDIKVTCTKPPGKMWASTSVMPRGKPTHLTDDASKMKEWTSSIPVLDDLYTEKTYEDLEKIINVWLASDDDDSEGTSRGASENSDASTSSSDAVAVPTSSPKYKSLEAAFAELED